MFLLLLVPMNWRLRYGPTVGTYRRSTSPNGSTDFWQALTLVQSSLKSLAKMLRMCQVASSKSIVRQAPVPNKECDFAPIGNGGGKKNNGLRHD